jgi:site-specific recombinase XerD
MIEKFFNRPHVRRRLKRGPLATVFDTYVDHLEGRGYGHVTIQQYVQAVEHFGGWMARRRHVLADVEPTLVTAFLARHLACCRCRRQRTRTVPIARAALRQLLVVLASTRIGPPVAAPSMACVDGVIAAFDQHLEQTCGLAPATRHGYRRESRALLVARFGHGAVDVAALRPDEIRNFVTTRAKHLCPASANGVSNAVRALVRFLALHGFRSAGAPAAVPRAAVWRLGHVPRVLSDAEVAAFLGAFDRTTALGRRDYAIAVCLLMLGLRAGEVAAITLDDIDWRAGTLAIPTCKSRRGTRLPLPAQVAVALADYLQRGRPATTERAVFVHHRAPRGGRGKASLIRIAVRRAYARAGLDPRLTGTHVLRHTAATRLLRAGASMKEIADVLRHRSLDTSAIYAKVDLAALQGVALAWPEVQP